MNQVFGVADPHGCFFGSVFLPYIFFRSAKQHILAVDFLRKQNVVAVIDIQRRCIAQVLPVNEILGSQYPGARQPVAFLFAPTVRILGNRAFGDAGSRRVIVHGTWP